MKYLRSLSRGRVLLLGDIGETDPALTIFDVIELHHDLFFSVAVLFDGLPEVDELVLVDLAIGVSIDLVKEFLGRDSAKSTLPVIDSLCFVDLLAAVHVKDAENFVHLVHALLAQAAVALYKTKSKSDQVKQKGNKN